MEITGSRLDDLAFAIDNYRMTDELIDYMWEDERKHYLEEIQTTDDWSRPHIFKTMFTIKFHNQLNEILKNLDDEDDHLLFDADNGKHLAISGNYEFDDVEEVAVNLSDNLGEYVALKVRELIKGGTSLFLEK